MLKGLNRLIQNYYKIYYDELKVTVVSNVLKQTTSMQHLKPTAVS